LLAGWQGVRAGKGWQNWGRCLIKTLPIDKQAPASLPIRAHLPLIPNQRQTKHRQHQHKPTPLCLNLRGVYMYSHNKNIC